MIPKCYVCLSECEGTSGVMIDDVFRPMCHGDSDPGGATEPTCYQKFCWGNHLNERVPGRFLTL